MFLLSKNLHLNAHKVSILNRQHKVLKSILKPFKAHFIGISAHGTGIKIRFAKQALQFPSIEEMGAVNETAVPPPGHTHSPVNCYVSYYATAT